MVARTLLLVVAAAAVAGTWGCNGQVHPQPARPPVPEVTVDRPVARDVEDYAEFSGWTEAARTVEIRAPVKGALVSVEAYSEGAAEAFEEGAVVEEGRLLFVLGQQPQHLGAFISASLAKRRALERLERAKEAAARETGAPAGGPGAESLAATAKRALENAQAGLNKAKESLDCCEIRAPFRGLVGRRHVEAWNLVGLDESTLLTTIVAPHPIRVLSLIHI